MLRAVARAANEDAFNAVYGDLINEVNHQGTMYEVTAYTVPFILELLQHTEDKGRIEAHLYTLLEFVRGARITYYYGGRRGSVAPSVFRHALALHNAVCSRWEQYATYLIHPDVHIRGLAMFLLT